MSGSSANDKLVDVLQDNGPPHQSQEETALRVQDQNVFMIDSERPLDVQPTRAGHLLDKATGKIEKVIGKVTQNAEKHEAGELREAGGKKAVIGEARAPHD